MNIAIRVYLCKKENEFPGITNQGLQKRNQSYMPISSMDFPVDFIDTLK